MTESEADNKGESLDAVSPDQHINSREVVRPLAQIISEPVVGVRARKKKNASGISRFRRFVSIGWSGAKEPAADLIWAEAHVDGDWVILDALERVTSRKVILERLFELKSALITLDFNFSFPLAALDFFKASEGINSWRDLTRTVREDLKKNVDDGLRAWLERLGRYRESQLDPAVLGNHHRRVGRFETAGWQPAKRVIEPHDQRSFARRFRRTDAILRDFGDEVMSTMQFAYNRLTSRYEFNGNIRGRDALIGMAMLEQLLDGGPEKIAVWPMMKPRKVTVVEVLPQLFIQSAYRTPNELENFFNASEDAGWDIPPESRAFAHKVLPARKALLTLMGVVNTEERLFREKHRRMAIRQYPGVFYSDARVQSEGWIYGVSYWPQRELSEDKNEPVSEQSGSILVGQS